MEVATEDAAPQHGGEPPVAVAAAAYFFWIREDDDEGSGDAEGVAVAGVAISNEIDSNGLPVNPRIALPAGTRAVRATIRLTGAETGMKVEGTWFQLGTARSGAEGAEVSTSEVVLTDDQISSDGTSRVSFSLGTRTVLIPPRCAARTFSFKPPIGNTRPRSVTSPVIATSWRIGIRVSAEHRAVAMVIPAEGPSFGIAPSGTWRWMSSRL